MGLFDNPKEFRPSPPGTALCKATYEDDFLDLEFDEEEPDLGDVSGLKTVLD